MVMRIDGAYETVTSACADPVTEVVVHHVVAHTAVPVQEIVLVNHNSTLASIQV